MSETEPTINYVYQPGKASEGERIYSVAGPDIDLNDLGKRMTKEQATSIADRLNKLHNRKDTKMIRVRFHANFDDPRPINWPVKHPYWVTGEAGDGSYSTVVSYADNEQYIRDNWPEATELEIQDCDGYQFTGRFPKPEWFKVEEE